MEIYHFVNGQPPILYNALERMPDEGLVWIDFLRSECSGWEALPRRLLGIEIDFQHVLDVQNANHPSSFDGTDAYDLLILEGLGPADKPLPMEIRVSGFFMFDRLLITVRAAGNVSIDTAKRRFLQGRTKPPSTILLLAHVILDMMVDRFLEIREPLDRELTTLQDELLDTDSSRDDWRALLIARREVRRLEALADAQFEALDAWRRNSRSDWSSTEEIRVRDLIEHVTRVENHAAGMERDLEAAVQLYFASISHRTNQIMKIFTVVSVVFMPPMLVTGIWGMNFKIMPELEWRYGYPLALTIIFGLCIGMLAWFRRRRLF